MKRLQKLPPEFVKELQKNMSIANAKRDAYQKKYQEMKQQALQASISGMQNSGYVMVYTNQVPYELDVLRTNLYEKTDMGWFIQTVLGVGVGNPLWAVGFPCNPISPPGLSVTLGPGVIYDFSLLLPTDYSVIPADTNPDHQIYKSYILFDTQTFATPAPVSPGNSIIYLIQGAPTEEPVNDVSRPYFNSADPSMPIFQTQSDTLLDYSLVNIKAGVEAPSPTPPTPDPGFTALYYVTVAYGATSIVSGDITVVPGAPFITESLTQKISSADIQINSATYAVDTGSVGALVADPTPAYPSYTDGASILVKAANTNGGTATLNVSGLGAVNINMMSSGGLVALAGGEIQTGGVYEFCYDQTNNVWQLLNPTESSGSGAIQVGQITMQAATTPDPGYLSLSTTPVNRTTYARLFSRIGTTWGVGDGSTTFNIPPPGAVPVGAGWGGYPPTLSDSVGATGGEAEHTQTLAELAAHSHTPSLAGEQFITSTNPAATQVTPGAGFFAGTAGLTNTSSVGSSTPFNVIQPSMVVLFQIKY